MKNLVSLLLSITTAFMLVSCDEQAFHETKVFAGGKYATAAELNKGKQIYAEFCMPCHGVDGDGKGVAAKGMQVPPRDFTKGIFKFGDVLSGELPHDKHLYKILREGLHGTAMLPWDLFEPQMHMVLSYIKTFAPKVWEGKDKKLGEEITPTKDPYGEAHRSAAIAKGKEVYHITANCQSCHRAYITPEELNRMSLKLTGDSLEAEDDAYNTKPQDTDWGFTSLPPDFTWNEVRSAKTLNELYVRIAAGVGGTAMPSWKDTITDDEIWAVTYYVKSLMDMKDTPKRKQLMDSLK